MSELKPFLTRPQPLGGQARELWRDIAADLAVIQHQAAQQGSDRIRCLQDYERRLMDRPPVEVLPSPLAIYW